MSQIHSAPMISPRRWYAMRVILSGGEERVSPVWIIGTKALNKGKGELKVHFWHQNYPAGEQEKAYVLRVLQHEQGFLVAERRDSPKKMLVLLTEITGEWVRSNFVADVTGDVQEWLTKTCRPGLRDEIQREGVYCGKPTSESEFRLPENPIYCFQKYPLPNESVERAEPIPIAELLETIRTSARRLNEAQVNPKFSEPWMSLSFLGGAVIKWLGRAALAGDDTAQRFLSDTAREMVMFYVEAARRNLPGIRQRAERAPEIPGWISRAPEVADAMAKICDTLNQGRLYPYPLKAEGKKREAKFSTPHHQLAESLHVWMSRHHIVSADFRNEMFGPIHPLVAAMADLPPLSPGTVEQWEKMGRKVLMDATNDNPYAHPAFCAGGQYASLGKGAGKGKPRLWERLREAWEYRANHLPANPPE